MMNRLRRSFRFSAPLFAAASAIALMLVLVFTSSPAEAALQAKKVNRFIGAQKCKTCHSSAETGNQFEALSKMKHAHAFEALSSEDAKKSAQAKSIEDPTKADACVKCHVTAFGVPEAEVAKSFDRSQGVQCESCHGAGEAHVKARMAAAQNEEPDAPKVYKALPEGEIVSNPAMTVCTTCHNKESPNYKPFCHCKFKLQIRHLNPKRTRTDAEKLALTACSCTDECSCKKECCKDGACSELAKPAK